jgi:tryptophan synthase alpha chain
MELMSANTLPEAAASVATSFERARRDDRAALIPFVPAGHPSPESSLDVLLMLADEGADVIELGIPFSDPLADGPIIQRASFAAIASGVDTAFVLGLLQRFRALRATPVVLFSYLNPILRYGIDAFLRDAAAAGAQGLLLTDLPAGSDAALEAAIIASPLDLVRLVAPTTPTPRAHQIARSAGGFVYYVSRTGVTGVQDSLPRSLALEIAALREACAVPLAVGFGVSNGEQAASVARLADGVVVGSALVDALAKDGLDGGRRLMQELRPAMKHVTR